MGGGPPIPNNNYCLFDANNVVDLVLGLCDCSSAALLGGMVDIVVSDAVVDWLLLINSS
jgi:hypothetical protein